MQLYKHLVNAVNDRKTRASSPLKTVHTQERRELFLQKLEPLRSHRCDNRTLRVCFSVCVIQVIVKQKQATKTVTFKQKWLWSVFWPNVSWKKTWLKWARLFRKNTNEAADVDIGVCVCVWWRGGAGGGEISVRAPLECWTKDTESEWESGAVLQVLVQWSAHPKQSLVSTQTCAHTHRHN